MSFPRRRESIGRSLDEPIIRALSAPIPVTFTARNASVVGVVQCRMDSRLHGNDSSRRGYWFGANFEVQQRRRPRKTRKKQNHSFPLRGKFTEKNIPSPSGGRLGWGWGNAKNGCHSKPIPTPGSSPGQALGLPVPHPRPFHPSSPTLLPRGEGRLESPLSPRERGGSEGNEKGGSSFLSPFGREVRSEGWKGRESDCS